MPPVMTPVSSSNLSAVGYDGGCRQLFVQFNNGTVYRYFNVPFGVYEGLMSAGSHGRYLNYFIRRFYPYQQVR